MLWIPGSGHASEWNYESEARDALGGSCPGCIEECVGRELCIMV